MTQQEQLQKAFLEKEHEIWLKHPTTQKLLVGLRSLEMSFVGCLIRDLDPTETAKAYGHGVALKVLRDVCNTMTNTEQFIARTTPKEKE